MLNILMIEKLFRLIIKTYFSLQVSRNSFSKTLLATLYDLKLENETRA